MDPVTAKDLLAAGRRVVIKIGSSLLIDPATAAVNSAWLNTVAQDILALRNAGQQVVIVTSGSIALGRGPLKLTNASLRLDEKQAAAATGQGRLAHAYQDCFGELGIVTSQVLLTIGDTERRRSFLNARTTFDTLLRLGAVPVVNENDTVATQEIRFGDNDRLAARVAQMIGADVLVLLSDVDGLYDSDPRKNPKAKHIPVVRSLNPEVEAMASDTRPGHGTGGMVTKLMAAKIALGAGCHMAIAPGHRPHPIKAMTDGGRCTWFLAQDNPPTAYKQWIAAGLHPAGAVTVDAGAAKALTTGKSLLPAGVTAVQGTFDKGDTVIIQNAEGKELGRGLIAYSAEDTAVIKGRHSDDIESLLGYAGQSALIHRNDLVLHQEA